MKAVILVGGLGKRLRPLTFSIPKSLLSVGGKKPILQTIIEHLIKFDVNKIIFSTGYLSELIEVFCGDGSKYGITFHYTKEDIPLGTAGPLSLMRHLIDKKEDFILMNGDIITDLDFSKMVAFHKMKKYPLTVGYTKFIYKSPFGVLKIAEDKIKRITEKPSMKYLISSGIYILNSSALKYIPDNTFFSVPELINKLLARGENVGAYYIHEFWCGIEDIFDLEVVSSLNINNKKKT